MRIIAYSVLKFFRFFLPIEIAIAFFINRSRKINSNINFQKEFFVSKTKSIEPEILNKLSKAYDIKFSKIKDKLGSVSGNTVYDVLKSIMANENDLDEVFKKKVGKINSIKDSVVLQFLSNDWTSLAKTSSSSQRLVKFWISSALTAYGVDAAGKRTYAINEDSDQFLIF